MKKCLPIIYLSILLVGCQRPNPVPVPSVLPVIEKPESRSRKLAGRPTPPTTEELIVALTLDVIELEAALDRAISVMKPLWPVPKKEEKK